MNQKLGYKSSSMILDRFLLLPLLMFIILSTSLVGQANTYRFKHFTTEEGLSHHHVKCSIEDSNGFIWIGTVDGLNRFDGYTFKTFYHDAKDSMSLNSDRINTLFLDSRGIIYVGTNIGLNRYNPIEDKFYRVPIMFNKEDVSANHVNDIEEDKKGNIWIATEDGIIVLNKDLDVINRYLNESNESNSIPNSDISQLLFDKDNKLWIGGTQTISRLNIETGSFTHYSLKDKFRIDKDHPVNVIAEDSKGRIWIGSNRSGLSLFDRKKQEFNYYELSSIEEDDVLRNRVRDISEDENGNLWLATFDGLIIFNPDTKLETKIIHDTRDPYSINNNGVTSILRDKRGNYWLGVFYGGINYLDKNFNSFRHYQHTGNERGPSYNVITYIEEGTDDEIWIATDRGGLNLFNPISGTFEYFQQEISIGGSAANHIMHIEAGVQGNLWIGTLYGGLFSFDIKSKKFTKIKFYDSQSEDLSINRIKSLKLDSKGNLWVAHSAGIHYYNPKTKEDLNFVEHFGQDFPLNNINTIHEDRQGNIWFGMSNKDGLIKIEGDSWEFEKYNIPAVQCIFEDNENIWIGSGSKLFRIDNKTENIETFESKQLSNSSIIGILDDDSDHLWLSTTNGLFQFHKSNVDFTRMHREHGLENDLFKRNASIKSSNGDLYFGGINGIIAFDPEDISEEAFVPQIEIIDITVGSHKTNKTAYSPSKGVLDNKGILNLPYHQNILFIDFVAFNYSQAEKTEYAYRLEGFDDWNYIGTDHKATYTNLDPGTYSFQIKATDSNGIWSSQSKPLAIYIAHPPWNTWWAYLLYLMGAISLSILIKNNVSNRLKLENELRLEHFKNVQEKELHELKYRFFTNISHDLRTPLTLIIGPLGKLLQSHQGDSTIRSLYTTAYKNAEHLLRLVNQLMDFRKLETNHTQLRCAVGNIVLFMYEIFISFQEQARFRNIEYSFDSDQKNINLFFDRDKIEKIFYNLLSNAFKYSPDNSDIKVLVHIDHNISDSFPEGHLQITIQDSGIGIPATDIEGIFDRFSRIDNSNYNSDLSSGIGLNIAKGFVELHKGKIFVDSILHSGTNIMVQLPIGSAHLNTESIITDFQSSESESHYNELSLENTEGQYVVPKKNNDHKEEETLPLILLVEDNIDIQFYIAGIFNADYRIVTANDGQDGWEKALRHNPDLIISDVMMPKMNGIELCSRLKREIKTSHIPVILLSARTSLVFKVNGLETGADDYVGKPFAHQVLELKVKNLIESRKKLRDRFVNEFNLSPKELAVTTADERFLDILIKSTEKHMKNPEFGIEFLSKEVQMTRGHLYRKIKALTNMTATGFVRSIRLQTAANLLKNTLMNINEVCYEIGFQDPNYYRKCFKNRYGVSPSEYRKNPSEHLAIGRE
ncbi:MAG: signal transduction histidine kinase/ligand-binding sensor domain-containing protein [Saprospiraceae bacterium]|jgi:signal transduction histidine kinase/ligand-binding sensor domain-containing protein/DNA-binding response OmpR family regulator